MTTFGSPILLKAGLATYDVTAFGAPNRWGDYSATRVDPADPRAPALGLYAYLSWLQEQLVEALASDFQT